MIEAVYTTMRIGRNLLQRAANPADWVVRVLNNKHGHPPLVMRQAVGNLSDFEGSSAEYVAYLKLLCNLRPGDKLLDIGCGCGNILYNTTGAGSLLDYLGEYTGWDINTGMINWCKGHLARDHAFFSQVTYEVTLSNLRQVGVKDVVLAKSLFTHLNIYKTEAYLRIIFNVLRAKGTCLSTWFLLNDTPMQGKFDFKHAHGQVSFQRDSHPDLAVAYEETWLLQHLKKLGFSHDIYYGTWRGTPGGLSFQDIIVLKKGA